MTNEPPKLSIEEFAKRVRTNFSDYDSLDDLTTTKKFIKLYPELQSKINWNDTIQSPLMGNAVPAITPTISKPESLFQKSLPNVSRREKGTDSLPVMTDPTEADYPASSTMHRQAPVMPYSQDAMTKSFSDTERITDMWGFEKPKKTDPINLGPPFAKVLPTKITKLMTAPDQKGLTLDIASATYEKLKHRIGDEYSQDNRFCEGKADCSSFIAYDSAYTDTKKALSAADIYYGSLSSAGSRREISEADLDTLNDGDYIFFGDREGKRLNRRGDIGHAGVIIRDENTNELYIMEAASSLKGVAVNPLRARLGSFTYHKLYTSTPVIRTGNKK